MIELELAKNYQSSVVEAGGHDNVSFLEKDCRNYIDKKRKLRLGVGDAQAIHNYFIRMQAKNSSFFYMMDLDDNARIRNLFWADAKSMAAYEEFGDVITFDTTYLTNKYDMPFASFVGVNHHGYSILFGCGILSSEDIDTFIWLFRTWKAFMSGRASSAIITDQDKAMQKAIEIVFPDTRHRWCLWHIMKKIPEKLRGYRLYDKIKSVLHNVVYQSLEKEEFEEKWEHFIIEFNLRENVWLDHLYKERHRWVPAFVNDTFWAGMSTTQRSESMNAFFDDYVNSKTTLKQFVEQYDNALRRKVEKENRDDFQSFTKWIPCVTHFELEKQFQSVYTNSKFKEFQRKLTGKLYCEVSCIDEKNGVFDVVEDILVGDRCKKLHFTVCCDEGGNEVKCACRLFEFRGILCKHILFVLLKLDIHTVPEKYILACWRKDLKISHTRVEVTYDDWKGDEEAQHYHKLQKEFDAVAELAVISDENYAVLVNMMDEFESKVSKNESSLRSTMKNTIATMSNIDCCDHIDDFCKASSESNGLRSPLAVRRHGRPPKNRKVSSKCKV